MIGYYKLDEELIKKLPKNSKDIEDNIYDLAYPLITNDKLPKDLEYLYETLEIPVIKFEEYDKFKVDEKFCEKIKVFSKYLQLNIQIEMLEEGVVGHTLRVGRFVLELCNLKGLDKKTSKKIYIAGLFHDIGKIKIPKKIISKPASLNDKEYNIMKKHTLYAYEILKNYLDEETLEMITSHHERCDKSGYPKGIIPSIGAKIIGIADSYDAMLSKRVYNKNKSLKSTLEELLTCTIPKEEGGKGVLYDKDLVKKFIDYHGYNLL